MDKWKIGAQMVLQIRHRCSILPTCMFFDLPLPPNKKVDILFQFALELNGRGMMQY